MPNVLNIAPIVTSLW